jgi:hypothetical protein
MRSRKAKRIQMGTHASEKERQNAGRVVGDLKRERERAGCLERRHRTDEGRHRLLALLFPSCRSTSSTPAAGPAASRPCRGGIRSCSACGSSPGVTGGAGSQGVQVVIAVGFVPSDRASVVRVGGGGSAIGTGSGGGIGESSEGRDAKQTSGTTD